MSNKAGMASDVPVNTSGTIRKQGFLKKLKHMRKKYFVLREESSQCPAQLQYYDSEKKFKNGGIPKRAITIKTCFNINKKCDTKYKNAIALYTKDDCFSFVCESPEEQELWLTLLLELQGRVGEDGESPRPQFEHVWQVTVRPKCLGSSHNITGPYRLCLTNKELSLVKMHREEPQITFNLAAIRRCGHSDCFFFIEVGRQSVTGAGMLWMQVEDTIIAQNMHEAILSSMTSMPTSQETLPSFRPRTSSDISKSKHPTAQQNPREGSPGTNRDGTIVHRPRTTSEGNRPTRKGKGSPTRHPHAMASVHTSSLSSVSSTGHSPIGGSPLGISLLNEPYHPSNFRVRSDSTDSRGTSSSISTDQEYDTDTRGSIRSGTPDMPASDISETDSTYLQMTIGHPGSLGPSPVGSIDTQSSAYMQMNMTNKSVSPSNLEGLSYADVAGTPSDSYMPMTPTSSLSSSPCHLVPSHLSEEPGPYVDMGHLGHTLPTVQEKSGIEGYMDMSPGQNPPATMPRPAKGHSYLLETSSEFPKRAYSVGSRPTKKSLQQQAQAPYMEMVAKQGTLDNSKSSSAPHLEDQIKLQDGQLSNHKHGQPMRARPFNEADLFMEMDFNRPRTASDSYNYRPRTHSWGTDRAMFRPRSASHSQTSRYTRKGSAGGLRVNAQDLRKGSQDSIKKSSQESLTRLGLNTDGYMEMSPKSHNSSLSKSPNSSVLSHSPVPKPSQTPDYMVMSPVDTKKTIVSPKSEESRPVNPMPQVLVSFPDGSTSDSSSTSEKELSTYVRNNSHSPSSSLSKQREYVNIDLSKTDPSMDQKSSSKVVAMADPYFVFNPSETGANKQEEVTSPTKAVSYIQEPKNHSSSKKPKKGQPRKPVPVIPPQNDDKGEYMMLDPSKNTKSSLPKPKVITKPALPIKPTPKGKLSKENVELRDKQEKLKPDVPALPSRRSLTDLTKQVKKMPSRPSNPDLKTVSTTEPQLNYASLDLGMGSSEDVVVPGGELKSYRVLQESQCEEKENPLSYAEIDFAKLDSSRNPKQTKEHFSMFDE